VGTRGPVSIAIGQKIKRRAVVKENAKRRLPLEISKNMNGSNHVRIQQEDKME